MQTESLRGEHANLQVELTKLRNLAINQDQKTNLELLGTYMELSSRVRNAEEENRQRMSKSQRKKITEQIINVDPRMEFLRSRLESVLVENQKLVAEVRAKGEFVRKSVSRNFVR